MKDFFNTHKLPSFMRIKDLRHLEQNGNLHYIYFENQVAGFYTIVENTMFKNLFILPQFRKNHLATDTIKMVMAKQKITVAVTRRNCPIKLLIKKLGFHNTNKIVQGKQSLLEIWSN